MKRKKRFLCWIWEEAAPALSFMRSLPLALLSSPLPSTGCLTQASLAFGAIPPPPQRPSPSAHHSPARPSPNSLSTAAPQPFVPFYPLGCNSAACPLLPPHARKGERWGRERFPQLCAEMFKCVKRQSLSPLQPTSCCCHKSRERRGAGSVGGTL